MRTEQTKECPAAKKARRSLKWFVLFLAVIFFLPITILAVVEWFTSADAFAIGITGFMQAVIVYGGLGLVAVIIALVLFITAGSAGRNVPAEGWQNRRHSALRRRRFLPCPAARFGHSLPQAPRKQPIWSGWSLNIREGSGDYGSDDYYLRGVDMTGERHSFEISEKRYEEGARAVGRERLCSVCESHLPAAHLHLDNARIYDRTRRAGGRIVTPHPPNFSDDWGKFFHPDQ